MIYNFFSFSFFKAEDFKIKDEKATPNKSSWTGLLSVFSVKKQVNMIYFFYCDLIIIMTNDQHV